MAVSKQKTAKSTKGKRKYQFTLSIPSYMECPQCNEMTRPHHICSHCGYYKGKEIMEVEEV